MYKIFNKFNFLLLATILLAILLRLPLLSTFPPSMLQDEVGLIYNAISIAETGKDEWGEPYPLVFTSFGDYKPPGFIYFTAIVYKIFGWNEVLPRVISAISGVLIVILTFVWIRKAFNSKELGLFAALVVAISPWAIHLSRMAMESNFGLLLFLLGLTIFEYSLNDKKSKYWLALFSAIFFAMSTYVFHSFRFVVLLYFSALIIIYFIYNKLSPASNFLRSNIYILIFILLISTALSIPGLLAKGSINRLSQTSIATKPSSVSLYDYHGNNCHLTVTKFSEKLSILCRLQYNKVTVPVIVISQSLFDHLSPSFAFFTGDNSFGRNPAKTGALPIGLFIFWMAGLAIVFTNLSKLKSNDDINRRSLILRIALGYLISIAPSVVSGEPHATRLSVHMPFIVVIIVIGFEYFYKKYRHISYLIIVSLFISLYFFVINYSSTTFANSQDYLGHGKEVVTTAHPYYLQNYKIYTDEDLMAEPHIYFAYWNRIKPSEYHNLIRDVSIESGGFTRPQQLGNNLFFKQADIKNKVCSDIIFSPTLFITRIQLPFEPDHVIKNYSQALDLVYFYNLETMLKQEKLVLSYCRN
jgi:4-amino-4-deoxy-L-arabinose transferase-like glycosyltransferase